MTREAGEIQVKLHDSAGRCQVRRGRRSAIEQELQRLQFFARFLAQ
jgi:hypothetical protein